MNTLVQECMNSIDKLAINDFNAEVEESVALLDVYSKAANILEYYEGEDLSAFRCFSEYAEPRFIQETEEKSEDKLWDFEFRHDKKDGSGKERLFWSILLVIPRLFIAIFKFIGRGLQKLFTGETGAKKASSTAGKALADATPEEKAEIIAGLSYDIISKNIVILQEEKLKNMKDNEFSCIMLNKEAFAPENFKAMRAGTYENTFYIMPPFVISKYIEELKNYNAMVVAKFNETIPDEIKKALEDANAWEKVNEKAQTDITNASHKLTADSKNKLTKAETIRNIQSKSGKSWVTSVEGYDPEKAKITPGDFYKALNELHKVTKLVTQETEKTKAQIAEIERKASSGTVIPAEALQWLKTFASDTKAYNESMMQRTTMLFDIPENYVRDTMTCAKNSKTLIEKLLGKFKGKDSDDRPDDSNTEGFKNTRAILDREMHSESAVPDVRDAYYQDDNITAVAY